MKVKMRTTNLKSNDLELYETYAEDWWLPSGGMFSSLRGISKFRLALINNWIPEIAELDVVDLGCGGGLLSAPLSRAGSRVTGVDISAGSLAQALNHSDPTARYIQSDIRKVPLPNEHADVVILADVLDHIPNYEVVLREAARLLRPGGRVFINTINRNPLSRLLAITVGENIGLVPKGTHDYELFIKPQELQERAEAEGFRVESWQGERPAFIRTVRNWAIHFVGTDSLSIAYSALLSLPR